MTEEAASRPPGGLPPGVPPRWKFAVVILLGLYPLLILIIPLVGVVFGAPFTIGPTFLARTLVTVLIVVPLMVWVAVPLLMRLLGSWLRS